MEHKVSEIGACKARSKFGSLLDRVQDGEEIVITRHGKRVARLISEIRVIDRTQARAAAERIRARASSLTSVTFNWNTLKRDRDEGRL